MGACQCARQAGRRASPASVGASVSASTAAARGSLCPAASDEPLGLGAPPTLGSAAERPRLGLCDLAVPLPLPFLPPGEEQGSLRLLRTAPSRASRRPWLTGPRARRQRRRHSTGERTSGEGGGAEPAEASRSPAGGPCQLPAPRCSCPDAGRWFAGGSRPGGAGAGVRALPQASAGPGRGPPRPAASPLPAAQPRHLKPPA